MTEETGPITAEQTGPIGYCLICTWEGALTEHGKVPAHQRDDGQPELCLGSNVHPRTADRIDAIRRTAAVHYADAHKILVQNAHELGGALFARPDGAGAAISYFGMELYSCGELAALWSEVLVSGDLVSTYRKALRFLASNSGDASSSSMMDRAAHWARSYGARSFLRQSHHLLTNSIKDQPHAVSVFDDLLFGL